MTVAAVAAGAVVAAGQTMAWPVLAVESDESPEITQLAVSTLLPVADVEEASVDPLVDEAIGGDQLAPSVFRTATINAGSQVDVANLAKATDIGDELARTAAIINSALAEGAPEAYLVGDTAYVKPLLGRFTSGFGARWGSSHNGIDIANRIGTPIYAVTDAVVEESGPAAGFGMWIVLRHDDGTQSVYGHINRSFVTVGQRVSAGEQIAEVGNRGFSTGPHLHLEVWDADGSKINPTPWLAERGITF